MDVTGEHQAAEKICPFSLNEREPRNCITKKCMSWEKWIGGGNAGVCLLIGDAPWSKNVRPVVGKDGYENR